MEWLPAYRLEYFKGDLVAALAVGLMLIPQGELFSREIVLSFFFLFQDSISFPFRTLQTIDLSVALFDNFHRNGVCPAGRSTSYFWYLNISLVHTYLNILIVILSLLILSYLSGLYTALVPLFMYTFFGSSRELALGPTAMVSLILPTGNNR